MPVRKYYECTESFNSIEFDTIETIDKQTFLFIKTKHEDDQYIEVNLTRMDLLNLIQELENINEIIYDKEKEGGNNA